MSIRLPVSTASAKNNRPLICYTKEMRLTTYANRLKDWSGRHKRSLLLVFFVGLALQVALQLVYPYDRALPRAQLQSVSVAGWERDKLVARLQSEFSQARVNFRGPQTNQSRSLAELGATVNADKMAAQLTSYSLAQRLIPFSLFMIHPVQTQLEIDFNDSRLDEQTKLIARQVSSPAIDAALAISKGELVVTKSRAGYQADVEGLKQAIKTKSFTHQQSSIRVPGDQLPPKVGDASIADVRVEAEAVLGRPTRLTVSETNQEFKPSRAELAAFLTIEPTKKADDLKLGLKHAAIDDYVARVWQKSLQAPQPTLVKLVDGKEKSRRSGASGRGIDRKLVATELASQLLDGQPTAIDLYYQRQPIASPIQYSRDYTSSHAGLTAYVQDVTASGQTKLVVTQLGASGWQARGGADDAIPSASTYKLFVMLRVFEAIADHKLDWSSKVLDDANVSTCFERTIVLSTNPCAEEWLRQFGRREMNNFVSSKGFSAGTSFTNQQAVQTTAGDLNKFLVRLEQGSLVNRQFRTMLMEKMGRQIYRSGVPAGTSSTVYNKVGFLWDYVHDAAIVRHPKGSYVIVVMTKGQSYQQIAQITRQVERILYG